MTYFIKSKIKKVRFYVDGNEVGSDGSAPFGYTFNLANLATGSHKFKAKAIDSNGNEGDNEITLNVIPELQADQ